METSCISTLIQELAQARDNRDALSLRMRKAEERISAIAHVLYDYSTISINETYDTVRPDGRHYAVEIEREDPETGDY